MHQNIIVCVPITAPDLTSPEISGIYLHLGNRKHYEDSNLTAFCYNLCHCVLTTQNERIKLPNWDIERNKNLTDILTASSSK